MTILCGTDFSFHANEAARTAAVIATRLKGKLLLAHVLDLDLYSDASPEMIQHLKLGRLRRLESLAQQVRREGAEVDVTVIEGAPAAKLAELAASRSARFLVVSAAGQIMPGQWFSQSVADQAVLASSVPSLLLRNPGLMQGWLRAKRPLRVVIAHDGSDHGDRMLAWAASLDEISPCDLTVIHVASAGQEKPSGDNRFAAPIYSGSALRQLLECELRQRCDDIMGGDRARVSLRLHWNRPDSKLLEMANNHRADLLVLGHKQRERPVAGGSVLGTLLHNARMNVACVPECTPETPLSRSSARDVADQRERGSFSASSCFDRSSGALTPGRMAWRMR